MNVTKKIDRYNNDFYPRFKGNCSGQLSTNLSTLNNSDWSISFFANTSTNASQVVLDSRTDLNNVDGIVVTISRFGDYNVIAVRLAGNIFTFSQQSGIVPGAWACYTLNYDNTAKTLSLILNGVNRESINISTWTVNFVGNAYVGSILSYQSLPQFNFVGGIRDLIIATKTLSVDESYYLYSTNVLPPNTSNILHHYPINDIPFINGGNFYLRDVVKIHNPSATAVDMKLIGWTDTELGIGVGGLPTSTAYRKWEDSTNYVPTIEYSKGLNMTTSQSLTFQGLTIGDKIVVNYDEGGIAKRSVTDVNSVNYTFTPTTTVKVRLIVVVKQGYEANEKVYQTIFNNGILRSGLLSTHSYLVDAETNLINPIDDSGTLKFPDVTTNNRVIIANGYTDLTDLQNNIN